MVDVTDLKLCQQLILEIAEKSDDRRNYLFSSEPKKITEDEYLKIGKQIDKLLRKHNELTVKTFNGLMQNLIPNKARITRVTQNLDNVINRLEEFNKSINFLSKIINFFGGILDVGSRGVAGIPDILSGLESIISG